MINKHYLNRYNKLIEHRLKHPLEDDVYGENHHITPKCMGGNNDKDNIVKLSAREHFIAHYLLAKAYPHYPNLWYAFNMMSRICEGKSALYESARKHIRDVISGDVSRSEKISKSLTGRSFSESHKKKLSDMRKSYVGWNHSEDTKRKMSENGIKGKTMYHDPLTQETKYFGDGDTIPEGYVQGASEKFLETTRNRRKRMSWYHDPISKKNVRLGENEVAPEGYVKGRYVEKVECCGKMWDPGNLKQHQRRAHGDRK